MPPDRQQMVQEYRRRQRVGQAAQPGRREAVRLEAPAQNWVPIGPSVVRRGQGPLMPAVSGRVPGIAVAPGGQRVYIGAANGGVWRSDDAGQSWYSLMDAFDLNPTIPTMARRLRQTG